MKKGIKHEHKMTNCLKAIIFSILMLAPFFAIGVKCWYVANNKNAIESYRGEYNYNAAITLNEYNPDISNQDNWEESGYINIPYKVDINYIGLINLKFLTSFNRIGYDVKIDTLSPNIYNLLSNNAKNNGVYLQINYVNQDTQNVYIYNSLGSIIQSINNVQLQNAYFYTTSAYLYFWPNVTQASNITYINTYIIDKTLSNVFYSAVDELDDASIFSWTTETAVYDAINNMCVTLGIVSPPLAVLLTYWTLLTIIYVIVDIVIETFIFLTHWLNDKMV